MIYIGIDPDVNQNGIGIWNKKDKTIQGVNMGFYELLNYLSDCQKTGGFEVSISAGWLNPKVNFHNNSHFVSMNIGRNHQVGILIHEWCVQIGIPVKLCKPTDHKWDGATCQKFTGIKRSNQDVRDGIQLVFGI